MGQEGFIRRTPDSGFLLLLLLLTFSAFTLTQTQAQSESIQEQMRKFLSSHCNKQNQTLEQEEYETFIKCNPTQAAMIIRNVDQHRTETNASLRRDKILNEIHSQCEDWSVKRICQKRNFKLIEKCFDGQQKFVFYFLISLTDTICTDGELFTEFWETGGSTCLNEHLRMLTNEISDCLSSSPSSSEEETEINIHKITGCLSSKFSNCGSPETNKVIQNLLQDMESFYLEIKADNAAANEAEASSSASLGSFPFQLQKIIIFSLLSTILSMQL